MPKAWKYWGKMDNGNMVFVQEGGGIAIERDHNYLSDAGPDEKWEIYQKWPGLIPKPEKARPSLVDLCDAEQGFLRSELNTAMEKHKEQESVIDSLKNSNARKDEMIASLMEDIAELKGRIDTLHETNRRWKEEVVRRDGTIGALMAQIKEGRYSEGQ